MADSASSSLTHSIDVGQKITWRYRTSSQDGTFSGSYTETSQSSAVSCDINPGASQALASSCSGSSKNSTLTLTNAVQQLQQRHITMFSTRLMMDHIKHTLEELVFQSA